MRQTNESIYVANPIIEGVALFRAKYEGELKCAPDHWVGRNLQWEYRGQL